MSSSVGTIFRVQIFGESHGGGIGAVIDGVPAGIPIDMDEVRADMARRMARKVPGSTTRRETDEPHILSGIYEGRTTGSPIGVTIDNANTRSGDYSELSRLMRPSHADFAASVKYGGYADMRGGGHFSGRLTAPLVFAGAIARALLKTEGITVGSRLKSIGTVADGDIGTADAALLLKLRGMELPTVTEGMADKMRDEIEAARKSADSVGGVVETFAIGLPRGMGDPMFGGVESTVARAVFGVPAVKGVEFGAGFGITKMRGSEANDAMFMDGGEPSFLSDNNGGITGGITTGQALVVRTAFKPTASIGRPQRTIDIDTLTDAELVIHGRHDSCIAVRGLAAAEAAVLVALADLLLMKKAEEHI